MPLVQPMPVPRFQFFDANGDPVANGFLYTYAAGTNTPLATYNDHTGSAGALNSNPVQFDSGGYADIWLTAASYKLVLQDANHVQIWSIDGVPGLGSLIAVGDLPPLFTSLLAGGALNFTLSPAAPNTLFGRFAGTTGAPSYGAVGSTHQITMNQAGAMVGSDNLLYDPTTRTLSLRDAAANIIRLVAGTPGGQGEVHWGTASQPSIRDVSDWELASKNNQDTTVGPANALHALVIGSGGGTSGEPVGTIRLSEGAAKGAIALNNGNNGAGIFAGARIICGFQADPNGAISAETGSLFITTAGGAGTTLWVKESSPTDITGWVGK